MTTVDTLSKPFSIGTVFQKTFSVLGQGFAPIFLVTALMNVPVLLIGLSSAHVVGASSRSSAFIAAGINILSFCLQIIAEGILVFGAFRVLQGKSFDVGTSAGHAFRRTFTLLGLAIVTALAIGLAFMALVIPGIIVMTMYAVAVPACLVETKGVGASLGRSQSLTKGYRWQTFGIFFLFMVVSLIIVFGLTYLFGFTRAFSPGYVSAIAEFVSGTITGGFQAILVAVIYSELRYVKEGVGIDEIANVFA